METTSQPKRLYRATLANTKVSGVLGGIAEYIGTDPALVRALFILGLCITGIFPLAVIYIAACFIMPRPPDDFKPVMPERLYYRSAQDSKLFGILGGLAEYFSLDSTFLRLVFVCVVIITGILPGTVGYFAAYFVAPLNPGSAPAKPA